MVTAPSLKDAPCRSPTRFSGAITSPAKRAGLLEDRLGEVEGQVAVKPLREGAVEPGDMAHGEDHLGHGRAIGHEFLPRGTVDVGLRLKIEITTRRFDRIDQSA